jgi:hypothetical protein
MNIKPYTLHLNELNERCSRENKDIQFDSMQCKNDNFKSLTLYCVVVIL